MKSPSTSSRSGRGSKEPETLDPKQPILDVPPLNSFPYIGPPSHSNPTLTPMEAMSEGGAHTTGPAVVYVPAHATKEELDNLVAANKSGVVLSGSAALGTIGPVVGRIEISENENTYRFRVLLPGVSRDEKDFSCEVGSDGKILIKGITTTGEKTVIKHSHVFKMLTHNFCPPGHFSISFQLPGPIENQLLGGSFVDGILEGLVKKSLPAQTDD